METFVFEVILIVLFSNFGAGPVEQAAADGAAVEAAAAGGMAAAVGTLGLFVISLLLQFRTTTTKANCIRICMNAESAHSELLTASSSLVYCDLISLMLYHQSFCQI